MPYDPVLAERIREVLRDTPGLTERKMFGGIGWMIGGNMAAGAHSDGSLMVRAGKEESVALVDDEPGAELMVHGGRVMRGWILVNASQVETDEALRIWVGRGRDFAASLPPK